jgi:hypothetical protein
MPYDATGKDLFELAPAAWLGILGQPRPQDRVRMIDADLSATVSTATDKVIYVDDPSPWLAMFELQANWDGDLPYDILRRFSLLRHRHRMPVSCVVVLMRPSASTSAMTGTFLQPDPLGTDWPFPFHVVRLWELPADTFLQGPLGLLPFAPIALVDRTDATRVKSVIKDRLINEASRSQREILAVALIQLLALRYDKNEVGFWRDLMATLDISKTPLVKMFQEEAQLEQARADLLRMAQKKFGSPATPEAASIVAATSDLSRLNELMERVFDVDSWQELLAS